MPISTVVTSMKDEAPYVLEWVAYHRAIGFDRVVVLANDCTDGTHEMLMRLHEIGAISYYENVVPVGAKPHSSALKIANKSSEVKSADFVMVLDADEFLVIKDAPHTLNVLLDEMQNKAADMMVIPWRMFGSSHQMEFEDLPVIKRFTQSMDARDLPKVGVKTLFRQADNIRLAIHFPKSIMKGGEILDDNDASWIDAGGQPLVRNGLTWNGGRQKIRRDHAEVAHFMIKSLDEYLLKIFRGDGLMNSNRHGIDYWRGADHNVVTDLVVADNVPGFAQEHERLFADPILSELHHQAVAKKFEKLSRILTNPDVQKLRTILKRSTSGKLEPEDIQTSRALVTQMSPAKIETDKLIDGDIPYSTLVSITDAGLADASAISWRMFKDARQHSTMFWPEKKFGRRPISSLVEGLKRAQSKGRDNAVTVRWFHNYSRAAVAESWPVDDEILVLLTRDGDNLLSGFPKYVAESKAKYVEKAHRKFPALRQVLTGTESIEQVRDLIAQEKVLDPRKRLAAYIEANPDAVVLNLDHPDQVNAELAELEGRGPSGPMIVRLLRSALQVPDPNGHQDGGPSGSEEKVKHSEKPQLPIAPNDKAHVTAIASYDQSELRTATGGMRVGIITLPMNRNYGGNLQAYALMTHLRRMGHEPVLINRRHGTNSSEFDDIAEDAAVPLYSPSVGLSSNVPNRDFVEQHLVPITRQFLSSSSLSRQIGRYDFGAVIVGSDQVWRPKYARTLLGDFFLGFLENNESGIRKISYAASFGSEKDEYKAADKKLVTPLLKNFDAVSVREDSAVDMCRDMFDVTAVHVLDPTLLLNRDDYSDLLSAAQKEHERSYLLTYVLDATPDKVEVIERISKKLAITPQTTSGLPFTAADPLTAKGGHKSVEGWLAAFRNADFVVTDSFHGVAFSIIFNRPFVAYGNAQRGLARFTSLLRALGLENRLVSNSEDADVAALLGPIDWTTVNQRLAALQASSLKFLADALAGIPPNGGKGSQSYSESARETPGEATSTVLSPYSSVAPLDAPGVPLDDRHPFNVHCTGCGACVSESKGTLAMAWTRDGFLEPRATAGDVRRDVLRVCPFNPTPEPQVEDEDALALRFLDKAPCHDSRIGRFVNTYVGYSKTFRPTSSSGGIATYVFDELINRGTVQHLFIVRRTPDGRYAYQLFDGTEDIKATSKTRYYPVTLEQLFMVIDATPGRIAVSGVACFVKAIRLKQHYHPELRDKIPFVVGIICGGLKSRHYTDFLAQSAGIKGDYKDAEYRVKSPDRLSSDYSFAAKGYDGTTGQIRMQKLGDMWGTGLFKSRACDFCTDVMTELADISLGDAWLPEYKQDGMGNSVVVTRTSLADEIVKQGIYNGDLSVREVSSDIAARTQSGGFNHKQRAVKFRLLVEESKGERIPPYIRKRMLNQSSIPEIFVQILRNRTRSKSILTWRRTKDNRLFVRQMRSSLRHLSAVTNARKQSQLVEQVALDKLSLRTNTLDERVKVIEPLLRWLESRIRDGRIDINMVKKTIAQYPGVFDDRKQP